MKMMIHEEKCPQDHACPVVRICPQGAVAQVAGEGAPTINYELCICCGKCVKYCPNGVFEKIADGAENPPVGSKNPHVDAFLAAAPKWREEMAALREIVLASGLLAEEIKWGQPCYTFEKNNVILIGAFKEYCLISFVKGVLLKDPAKILLQQTENVQSARIVKFTAVGEISALAPVLTAYIDEAAAAEKAGLKVEAKPSREPAIPEELQSKFAENPDLKTAFEKLTPGRQRAYLLHFTAPKQSKTRIARIEKCLPQILAGQGLNDYDNLNKKGE